MPMRSVPPCRNGEIDSGDCRQTERPVPRAAGVHLVPSLVTPDEGDARDQQHGDGERRWCECHGDCLGQIHDVCQLILVLPKSRDGSLLNLTRHAQAVTSVEWSFNAPEPSLLRQTAGVTSFQDPTRRAPLGGCPPPQARCKLRRHRRARLREVGHGFSGTRQSPIARGGPGTGASCSEFIGPAGAEPITAHQRCNARRPVGRAQPAIQPPISIVADRGELPHGVREIPRRRRHQNPLPVDERRLASSARGSGHESATICTRSAAHPA